MLHTIKLSGCETGIKLDKDRLAIEENNYLSKSLNVHIVHDFKACPISSANKFRFKSCLFEATNIVKYIVV